jgi:hypothetical protein
MSEPNSFFVDGEREQKVGVKVEHSRGHAVESTTAMSIVDYILMQH